MIPTVPCGDKTFRTNGFGAGISQRSLGKPPASFPSTIANDTKLAIAVDLQQTTLAAPLAATDTVMTVANGPSIVANSLLTIDSEIVQAITVTGQSVTISRGFDGTTPAAHLAGATVSGYVDAWHHNALVAEVEAIENALGTNLSNLSQGTTSPAAFNWCRTPGGTLSPGFNTITLSPAPAGVNSSSVNNAWVYISGGTGAAESALIAGYTAGSGSSTITVSVVNSHSGAWTVCSATSGIQEALLATAGNVTALSPGAYYVYGPIYVPQYSVVKGAGIYTTSLVVQAVFPLSASGVFIAQQGMGEGPTISDLAVSFSQPDSTSIASYTHWPPAFYMNSCAGFVLQNIQVILAWNVVSMIGNCGQARIINLQASHFNVGIDVDGALDTVYFRDVRFWPYGMSNNQQTCAFSLTSTYGVRSGRCDGLVIDNLFCMNPYIGYYTYTSTGSPGGDTSSQVTGLWLDTYSRAVFGGASFIAIANFFDSYNPGQSTALTVQGTANVQIHGGSFFPGNTTGSTPCILLTGTSPALYVVNAWFWAASADMPFISQQAGNLYVSNTLFKRGNASFNYTTGAISVTGGRASIIGCRLGDQVPGSTGNFLNITSMDYHQILGNSFPGWTNSIAPNMQDGVVQPSNGGLTMASLVVGARNYIATETGANNAIAGSLPGAPALWVDGMMVTIQLAHSLATGVANTFNFNATSALPIYSSRNPSGGALTTGYAANAMITLAYSHTAGCWVDVSQ